MRQAAMRSLPATREHTDFLILLIRSGYHCRMNITQRISVGISFCLVGLMGLLGCATMAADTYTESPGDEGDGNSGIGPEYKLDPDLTDLGNPKGKYFEFSMRLADSKI